MAGEEALNRLFEEARKAPLQTRADDARKWIGLVTFGTVLIGLLSKLNVVFTKTIIMYSAVLITAGVGLTTLIAFNRGDEKPVKQPGNVIKTGKTEQMLPEETDQTTAKTTLPQTGERLPQPDPERHESQNSLSSEVLTVIPAGSIPSEIIPEPAIVQSKNSEEKDYGTFSRIRISGAIEIYILQGSKESVRIEGDTETGHLYNIQNKGGTLSIGNADTRQKKAGSKDVKQKIYVTVVDISRIDCSGAIYLRSKGDLSLKKTVLNLSGASRAELNISLDELIMNLSGASDIKLSGRCGSMEINTSGACNFDASGLQAGDAKIKSSGVNYTMLHVTGKLEVTASGASDIKYKGNPSIQKTLSGTSTLKSI